MHRNEKFFGILLIALVLTVVACSSSEPPKKNADPNQLRCVITGVEYLNVNFSSAGRTIIRFKGGQRAYMGIYTGPILNNEEVIIYSSIHDEIIRIVPANSK